MRFYPDILDDAGRTPREFGSHQVHAEPIAVEDGFGWAVIWFQAAFQPCDPDATFQFLTTGSSSRVLMPAHRVPDVSGGTVVRGLVRFAVTDELADVGVAVKSRLVPDSERCRPAWKLVDTIRPGLVFLPEGGYDEYTPMFPPDPVEERRTPARPMPEWFIARLDRSRSPPRLAEGFAVAWKPGDPPLEREWEPPPVPPKRVAPITGFRECVKCDFSGAWKDFGEDEQCPRCGHWW